MCGQRRIDERLTVRAFVEEVARRVFRLDRVFAHTIWGMLRSPGTLVADYLEGRRGQILDPLHFFISCAFVQIAIGAAIREVAPLVFRASALGWLQQLGGVVALKIMIIFWMGGIWRLFFRQIKYNLAEIFVFATYLFGTTGLLWALLPIIDLIVPRPLGANPYVVSSITIGVEIVYATWAVTQFSQLPWWRSALRVSFVLGVGYGLLTALVGLERAVALLIPQMPT